MPTFTNNPNPVGRHASLLVALFIDDDGDLWSVRTTDGAFIYLGPLDDVNVDDAADVMQLAVAS